MTANATVETPSGKGARDENFPVGSWLLPSRLRPHIATFYAFARATDDIADSQSLSPQDKLSRLQGFAAALSGQIAADPRYEKAHRLRQCMKECGIPIDHGHDILTAFKQDATKLRYLDWDDLVGYCNHSAAPVGRFMIDIHGESREAYEASDPLCNALQILNHLQDCKQDYLSLNRVYLPQTWFAEAGINEAALAADHAGRGLRTVLDRVLDGVEDLLKTAQSLPRRLKGRRIAMEAAVIYRIAVRLTRLLRRRDPVAGRVQLSPLALILCSIEGMVMVLFRR